MYKIMMIVPKMMRYESVAVFLVTYSLFISSISNTCQVQSFTPSLSSSSSSSIRPSTLFQDTKHNNQNFLPSRVTDNLPSHRITISSSTGTTSTSTTIRLSDWSGFEALDDDDDLRDDFLDNGQPVGGFADENDEQERKAEVGNALPRPEVYWDGEPIFLPQGECLPLTEENVQGLLAACRIEIGTMFGYTAENRGVGITGGVDFVEMDGPNVVVTLKGRFWHQRPTVLSRVGKYIMGRIPEVVDVIVYDENELSDEVNNAAI